MKRKLEIRFDRYENLYELREVFYDPKDLLYSVHWSNCINANEKKENLLRVATRGFQYLTLYLSTN